MVPSGPSARLTTGGVSTWQSSTEENRLHVLVSEWQTTGNLAGGVQYFGSKEQLFTEVIATTMARPTVLTKENLQSPNLSRTIATILVNITSAEDTPLEGFLITFRSASSQRAAEIGRAQIEAGHHKTMTAALAGRLAPERAALVLALVSGVQVMRQMIGLSALAKADPRSLIDLLEAMLRPLIAPSQPRATAAPRVRSRPRRKPK